MTFQTISPFSLLFLCTFLTEPSIGIVFANEFRFIHNNYNVSNNTARVTRELRTENVAAKHLALVHLRASRGTAHAPMSDRFNF